MHDASQCAIMISQLYILNSNYKLPTFFHDIIFSSNSYFKIPIFDFIILFILLIQTSRSFFLFSLSESTENQTDDSNNNDTSKSDSWVAVKTTNNGRVIKNVCKYVKRIRCFFSFKMAKLIDFLFQSKKII